MKNRACIFLAFTTIAVLCVPVSAVSCRDRKAGDRACNPYDTNFLSNVSSYGDIKYLKNRPIIQKEIKVAHKTKTNKDFLLYSMVNSYIAKEENFRYDDSEFSSLDIESTVEDTIEIEKEQEELPLNDDIEPKKIEKPESNISMEVVAPKIADYNLSDEMNSSKNEQQKIKIVYPDNNNTKIEKVVVSEKIERVSQKELKDLATYSVKSGDSLIAISRKFDVNATQVRELNNLEQANMLKIGQKLYIPIPQEKLDAINIAFYIVKPGDSLGAIAQRFHLKTSDLIKYNKIRKDGVIHVGQGLVLPVPHKLAELKKIEAKKKALALKKKRERQRLAKIALKKRQRARFKRLAKGMKHKLSVTATAYTSHSGQTDRTPFLAAWNNRIRPGMKIIAVSRDLIYRYGITNGSKVRISGLSGIYTVRDKMNKRWRKKIDIYMGTNRYRALRWGRRRVTLYY